MKSIRKKLSFCLILVVFLSGLISQVIAGETIDPLPSWNDGPVKQKIIDYVKKVTDKNSKGYIPPEDRIATFDNDGTLWCEVPVIEMMFMQEQVKKIVAKKPELGEKPNFKAAMNADMDYFAKSKEGKKEFMEILTLTHTGMTVEKFREMAEVFFKTAKHPRFGVSVKKMTFMPMVELLRYLRKNGFTTFICSGGGIDFIRTVSPEIYGIPSQQVMGSAGVVEFQDTDGKVSLFRTHKILRMNDKEQKPASIWLHIGKKPVFSAGNVRSGGDIEMSQYCQSNKYPTLQLIVNHDDAKREYAYKEKNNETLNAAKKFGWFVISMKNDWKKIFSFEKNKEE